MVSLQLFSCAYGVNEITIKNVLDGQHDLSIHCQSKGQEYGVHVIEYNTVHSFTFGPVMEILCGFQWDNGKQFQMADIYTPQSLSCNSPQNKCLWNIIPSGPCLYHSTTFQYECHSWYNNSPANSKKLKDMYFPLP